MATHKRLDQYLVTVEELEQRTGKMFPEVPELARSEKSEVSWIMVYLPYVVMVNPSRDS